MRLTFFARLSFFCSRKGAKVPSRKGVLFFAPAYRRQDLPSLLPVQSAAADGEKFFFLFTQRRKGTKPLRGIFFAPLSFFFCSRKGAKPLRDIFFAAPLLCEIYFFSLREKIKMLENKPSLLALACKSLVPWSLKNEPNFRSPQKSKVTCHEFSFLHILKAN